MGQRITVVDAFTSRPFAGNPAAVCFLERPAGETWMQALAREMNLSETAFLHPKGAEWALRWFTPALEVDLCGHATLASSHLLWEEGRLALEAEARFRTRSGLLTARRREGRIEMNFPATPPVAAKPTEEIVRMLGTKPQYVGTTTFDVLVELESEEAVRTVSPRFDLMRRNASRGFIVTARAGAETEGYDFVSRYFAPAYGIDEDPVTGSAHAALGPYWEERLGRKGLVGFQCSARGGTVHVRGEGDRVILGGEAVTVLVGELAEG
jgi:PhzF family phenazine biosynthesis protein